MTIVNSYFVERCKPYRVRMSCGHVEKRMMREATAGVPLDLTKEWDVETNGRRCENCRESWE